MWVVAWVGVLCWCLDQGHDVMMMMGLPSGRLLAKTNLPGPSTCLQCMATNPPPTPRTTPHTSTQMPQEDARERATPHFGGKGRTVQGEKRQQAKRRVRCAPARTERTFSHNTTHTCCFLAGRRKTGKPTMQRAEEPPQGTRRKRKKVPVLCLSFSHIGTCLYAASFVFGSPTFVVPSVHVAQFDSFSSFPDPQFTFVPLSLSVCCP